METSILIGGIGLMVIVPLLSLIIMFYCILRKKTLKVLGWIFIFIGLFLIISALVSYIPMIVIHYSIFELIGLLIWSFPGIVLLISGIIMKKKRILDQLECDN